MPECGFQKCCQKTLQWPLNASFQCKQTARNGQKKRLKGVGSSKRQFETLDSSQTSNSTEVSRRATLGLLSSLPISHSCVWPNKVCADSGTSLLEKEVSEFTLSNGLHFIVLERRNAPIVSCHTHANVGAFNEVDGKTGLAHMLEHEAFKGSDRIGTLDWKKERPLLEAQDEVFYQWRQAKTDGNASAALKHSQDLLRLQKEAEKFAFGNEYGARFTQAGSVGLNASTSHDATKYHVSLPSNKLELWFALEAERFQASVFRELYSEKRVVLEERRARVDNSPLGKYLEEFNAVKFGNNYRRPVIGYQQDIENFGRKEVLDFFQRHYVPSKLTIAVVGDTDSNEVYKLADKYFGKWSPPFRPPQSTDELAETPVKPANLLRRKFEKASSAGPILMKGYYRGDVNSEDAFMMEVVDDVLTGGRTARFDTELVQTGRMVAANFNAASPGGKFACACGVFAVPSKGVGLEEADKLITQQLDKLASDGIKDWELRRIKKATKVDTLEAIRMNTSMAASLAATHALTGSWQTLLSDLQKVEDLTSDQVRDAAARVFQEENSFTGYIRPKLIEMKDQIGLSR